MRVKMRGKGSLPNYSIIPTARVMEIFYDLKELGVEGALDYVLEEEEASAIREFDRMEEVPRYAVQVMNRSSRQIGEREAHPVQFKGPVPVVVRAKWEESKLVQGLVRKDIDSDLARGENPFRSNSHQGRYDKGYLDED